MHFVPSGGSVRNKDARGFVVGDGADYAFAYTIILSAGRSTRMIVRIYTGHDGQTHFEDLPLPTEENHKLSAAIEQRRRFPGITDNAKARAHARIIAGWKPLPSPRPSVIRLRPRG